MQKAMQVPVFLENDYVCVYGSRFFPALPQNHSSPPAFMFTEEN
jgi:hypothetical protein